VVWLDFSESKNATVLAISSTVVNRFSSGILFVMDNNFSFGFLKVFIHFSYSGVKHSATTTQLTLIAYGSNSTAHSLVSEFRPPFAAAYPVVPP